MKKKSLLTIFVAVLLAGIAVALAGEYIGGKYPSATWRYKVTVEVETPEGLKMGSAVREVHIQSGLDIATEATPSKYPKGEAVVVDLGKRGVLFALMGFDDYSKIFDAFPYEGGGTTDAGLIYYSQLKNVKAVLTPNLYPGLVRFKDITDPKTVKNVFETGWCRKEDENGTCIDEQFFVKADHFEEYFGKGVKLKKITIEMTDEPLTQGKINAVLTAEFWNKYRSWMQSMNISERGNYIPLFAFRQGE